MPVGVGLDRPGTREDTAVDGVHDRLGGDRAAAEETTVETLDGVFAALDLVEFQVDVAFRVRIYGDVNNMAIFVIALLADVLLEFFDPVFA